MVDLVGLSLLNLVTEQDRDTVKETLTGGEYLFGYRSFFCQVRSAKGKRPNGRTKSPGRKLVYVSGRIRQHILNSGNSESEMLYFVGIAQVVKTSASAKVYPGLTSSFLTCRTTLELKVIEVNSERVTENVNCKDYWHPDDLSWNLVSFEKLLNDGQVVWFCHRIMYEGQWRWVQAQSSLVKNKFFEHSVAFVSDEVGKRVLAVRVAQAKNGILGSVSSPSQQSTGLFTSSSDSYLKEKSPATTTAAAATEVSDSFITCIASVSPQNSPSPQHSPGFTKLEKQLKPLPENRVITSELYRGIIPTLTNVVYPDQTSDCSMKGGSWDIEKAGSECLFWDSPSPPRFASLPTDEAESLCGSKEVDNIHCPADTLGRQMPVADCMFSPPDLTEMALFSALENVECDIPDVDLSCLDEILCQVQDNYLPMEPAGEERSKGFDQSVTVTKPLHTTVSTSFSPPLFSPSCTSAADPVCTIEICDKNTQSAYCQGSLLGNGCSELPVQPPPLTWDWAVGVNFMSDMKK
ncbi:uncharacterized protein LOC134179954 isoform X2 [Corticium candelabrum]|uniref:uncharacterized protein LOC134179954 isoform X2 n=1 Tax=Corticium candelabrum TaxID=121492 RepID=UPI002E25571E|nr:uncharacterized protein LOC134179954 isoform X2 [Corticium candelabrum]